MRSERRIWVDRGLFAAALALAGLVLFTGKSVTTSEVESRSHHVLVAWRQQELREMELESNGHRIELQQGRSEESGQLEWTIVGRKGQSADPAQVDRLLNTLRFATWLRTLDASEIDRSALGLNQPRATLRLDMGAISYRVLLGKPAVTPGGAAYLEVSGEGVRGTKVGVVRRDLAEVLLMDHREFVGRGLLPYARSEINRIELSGAGGSRTLVRDKHRFRFDGMLDNRLVDGAALDPLFFHLARLEAEPFLETEEAKRALKPDERKVELSIWPRNAEEQVRLEVGGRCPSDPSRVVAIRHAPRPLAGCVAASVMAGLTLEAPALLDVTPFSFPADAVERVVTERQGKRFELVRNEGGFQLKAPVDAKVELRLGNLRVQAIVDAKGEIVAQPDLAALGLSPPLGTTTVTGISELTNDAVEESVDLGKLDEHGRLPILRRSDQLVLLVAPEWARAFQVDATLSKSLHVFSFEEKQLAAIQVRTPQLTQKLVRKAGEFSLEAPSGFEVDASLVSALIDGLQNLLAERWVSDTNDGSFGLATPQIEVTLETKGKEAKGEQPKTLRVGREVPGGAYAELSGVPGVFVLSSAALRSVTTPVLSRAGFVLATDRLSSIELQTGNRRLTLRFRGGVWVSDTEGVDTAHADKIVEALSTLRPDFAVHAGPPDPDEGFQRPTLTVVAKTENQTGEHKSVIRIGATAVVRDTVGYYARTADSDASYLIEQHRVRQLLDLL